MEDEDYCWERLGDVLIRVIESAVEEMGKPQ